MKTNYLLSVRSLPTSPPEAQNPFPYLSPSGVGADREILRHILLGSPGAVRQTIHLLHSLRYAETVLWSPIMAVEEPLIITPEQGEAMSLLRRPV
jgi:hypothetical protein